MASKPSRDQGLPGQFLHWNDGVEGDGQSLIDVILVFQNVSPPHKSRAASGIDGIGNLHAAFASEHSLQIHIEPADADGRGGLLPGTSQNRR